MPNRVLIAFDLPPEIVAGLQNGYQNLTQKAIPIHNLHITLIPPCFLKTADAYQVIQNELANLPPPNVMFFLGEPGFFTGDNGDILYLPVLPTEPLTTLHLNLMALWEGKLLELDPTPYNGKPIPPYLPHVSLDYDYTDPALATNPFPPMPTFPLNQPTLRSETTDGWMATS